MIIICYNSNLDVLKRVFRLLCKDQKPFADFKFKDNEEAELAELVALRYALLDPEWRKLQFIRSRSTVSLNIMIWI